MEFEHNKFKALVLYVIWRAAQYEGFGATKLNKVLWFSDARHYRSHGYSITGETYVRQPHGPVPEHIEKIKHELEVSGLISNWDENYFGRVVRRSAAAAPPETSCFTAEQLMMVDWWLHHIATEHTASSVSELSHNYPWKIAEMGEIIPMHAVFAERIRPPDEEELNWAKSEAERLGLT